MQGKTEEEILFRTKPSRLNFLGKYIGAILFIILAILLGIDYFSLINTLPFSSLSILNHELIFWGVLGSIIISILLIIKAETNRYKIRYKISKYRVFKTVGILRKNTISIPFQKLERTDVNQSALERLVNIGTVRVDTGEEHFLLDGVPNPKEIDELIFEEGIKKQ